MTQDTSPRSDRADVSAVAGPALALVGMFSAQLGAVASVPLMTAHGAFSISAARLACAALVALVCLRPKISTLSSAHWIAALKLGLATAISTTFFYAASTRIPVGVAATIDFLGPLGVAVYALNGKARLALPAMAGAGIIAMTMNEGGLIIDPLGIVFALLAGSGWAAYIILMRHAGQLFAGHDAVVLPLIFAAVVVQPLAMILEPVPNYVPLLPMIAAVTILAPLIPFVSEMAALRRMDMGVFSILMSLEPAIGAILGTVLLGQILSPRQVAGMLAVIAASIAAVALTKSPPRETKAG